ncbi:MAG: tRNA pseudouridine(55) synthase TruB [Candidatus Gastranaerophilales bacterium]|nr:tRNA pseudouridine(55) synthase TruB [Candidatus Gastranaerophilales bacterium]
MFGVININKPKGITSFGVVAKLRKLLNIKKIGHSGTLDPLASGVLPVFISKATRLIQYAKNNKSYKAFARLGIVTDSYDIEGNIINKTIAKYNSDEIKQILKAFEGEIMQIPPVFSAIKVDGKKLYEYARQGKTDIQIEPRKVKIDRIYDIELLEQEKDFPLLVFTLDCESGVYVRSIIHDLGQNLGTGAMMENLIRLKSTGLAIEDSVNLDDLTPANTADFILDPGSVVDLSELIIDEEQYDKTSKGQAFGAGAKFLEDEFIKLVYNDKLIGIAQVKNSLVYPKTVLI